MDPEEFRRFGHQVVDWVADYRARVATLPVMASVEPGSLRASLPQAPPEQLCEDGHGASAYPRHIFRTGAM